MDTSYQTRVIAEENELHENNKRLGSFIETSPEYQKLPLGDQKLLRDQFSAQTNLIDILRARIKRFE